MGLGSVSSDRILPLLAPGINVLTIHPRYSPFHSWILDSFWAVEIPRTRSAFRNFYRPREALFAMGCHVCDAPEHATTSGNIVGRCGSAASLIATSLILSLTTLKNHSAATAWTTAPQWRRWTSWPWPDQRAASLSDAPTPEGRLAGVFGLSNTPPSTSELPATDSLTLRKTCIDSDYVAGNFRIYLR